MVIITFLRIRNKKLSLKQMFKIFKKPDVKAKLYHQVLYNWVLLLSQCSTAVCASVHSYMREVAGSNPATGNFLNILNIEKKPLFIIITWHILFWVINLLWDAVFWPDYCYLTNNDETEFFKNI